MSHKLIKRSADLKQLLDDGLHLEIKEESHLVIYKVPYLNAQKEVKYGTLVAKLSLAGDVTTTPDHVAYFSGEHPCHVSGEEIIQIKHQTKEHKIGENLTVNHSFSNQPINGYKNYHEMMTTYVTIITGPANEIDPSATAYTFPVAEPEEKDSVFKYRDSATSRAGINQISKKLEVSKIAILGVGGTGSYVLDFIAKTPVREIHIFDGDTFLQHNAFRSPGASSIESLQQAPSKAEYFEGIYSNMRHGVIPHNYEINESNVDELSDMDFVFMCIDGGEIKKTIVEKLEESDVSFIDVGMGIQQTDDALQGILSVTTSTPEKRDHLREGRVSFSDDGGNNEYSRNIQIVELNALNASLAVIKWKKLLGFYEDYENEHYSTYTIDGNVILNEDQT